MKTVIVLLILFGSIVLPALGELTAADLDKIRLIVKEEVKTEITASEKRMREYIDLKIDGVEKSLNARIDRLDQRIDRLDQRIDDVDKSLSARINDVEKNPTGRMNDLRVIMIALIGLIAAAIAIPQLIIAYKEKGQKEMEKRQEALQTEIQQLREQIESLQNASS